MEANELATYLIAQVISFQEEHNLLEGKIVKQLCLTLAAYVAANVDTEDHDLVLGVTHDFLRLAVSDISTAARQSNHSIH